jgi:two-component system, cell cycle response regulator DivK
MKLFHDVLEAHGYSVLQTGDGIEALMLARQHRPDLIVMDIQLPQVCGLEITRQIKSDDDLKAIPIIAVTAFAMKGDQARILESGCEAYIAKPMAISAFVATVAQLLSLRVDGHRLSSSSKRTRVP